MVQGEPQSLRQEPWGTGTQGEQGKKHPSASEMGLWPRSAWREQNTSSPM